LIGGTEATGHEAEAKFQKKTHTSTRSVLRLSDLEHAKATMLNSLNSADAKRGYRHAIRRPSAEERVARCALHGVS
jgi:hypothetical protein